MVSEEGLCECNLFHYKIWELMLAPNKRNGCPMGRAPNSTLSASAGSVTAEGPSLLQTAQSTHSSSQVW